MGDVLPFCPKVGVYDVSPFTMLDYPGELACLIWFAGCNLRCAYCHNPQMVRSVGTLAWSHVERFLESRKGKLSAVVLTGGEATLHPDLAVLAQRIRALGFKIKLDTNGTRPEVVKTLLEHGLLDYVALDYKAPRALFQKVTNTAERGWDAFSQTLDTLIAQDAVPFEVRTTVHTQLMGEEAVAAIRADLDARGYTGAYYVQNFRPCEATLGHLPPQDAPLSPKHVQTHLNAALPQGKVKVGFRNFS